MGTSIKKIELKKIIIENNRLYTKDEGFKQLVESIKVYGVIEAPAVREQSDGYYKVIAGRRRIAACNDISNGEGSIESKVYDTDDPRSDDEIALAENVNRQAMHPLDEAALFFKMECKGATVKEIAKLFARSPQDIYKRLRLHRLTDNLKKAFKNGFMDIAAAAVIAELPEEDQNEFYKEYKEAWDVHEREDDYKDCVKVYVKDAADFIQKKQKFKIKSLMKGCKNCKKRTHNTDNDLFEDIFDYDDVCLDPDCYRAKWKQAIEEALNEQIKENKELETERKIFFAGGVSADIYKQAKFVLFNLDSLQEPDAKFEIIKPGKYEFTHGETNRKKDCCWRICDQYDGQITVERIGYKLKEKVKADPEEKTNSSDNKSKKENDDFVRTIDREALDAIAANKGVSGKEIVEEFKQREIKSYKIEEEIEELLKQRIIERRIKLEKEGIEPPADYFKILTRQ